MGTVIAIGVLCLSLGWLLRSLFERRQYAVEAVWDDDDDESEDGLQPEFDEKFYQIISPDQTEE